MVMKIVKAITISIFSIPFLYGGCLVDAHSVTQKDTEAILSQMSHWDTDVRLAHISIIPENKLLKPRPLFVWLPPDYDSNTDSHYPVLYMQDGQNIWDDSDCCFRHGGWFMNKIARHLIMENIINPFIIVGIPNTSDRNTEYLQPSSPEDTSFPYVDFIINQVKPYIDSHYRTKPDADNTLIGGSSLGGIVSFWAAMYHPDIFSKSICMSSSFWTMEKNGDGAYVNAHKQVKIYLDSGTEGPSKDGMELTKKMADHLRSKGWKDGVDLLYYQDVGREHNEESWRNRLDKPLIFFFGK